MERKMELTLWMTVSIALVSAWQDWKARTIPNALTLVGICAGFLLSFIHGKGMDALIGFLSACLLLLPYAKGWLGGGDVKLMMTYGTLLGSWALLDVWIGAALISIPLAVTMALKQHKPLRKVAVPYAVPLALSVLWVVGRESLV